MTDLYASHQNFHTNRSGGGFSASQMPIKNRVKNIDVSPPLTWSWLPYFACPSIELSERFK